ncbi:glutamine--fructose-6-phosphate transaminase (isomerizing) [bacterium]|jgi:glutamine---fructose-6-phosphate transaminase (isomerizing)|nr:glutamine--fructose-6-phosphate transaminase (isomerizing) [bacterium]
MCGIVGYLGNKNISSVLLVGLERLSYRGYDSSGIAILSKNELSVWKQQGKIHRLSELLKPLSIQGNVGIGHTRWATHGVPNEANAHPHLDNEEKIAVVHNGIIENFLELKKDLQREGHVFRSETDSEVIAHLIERHFEGSLEKAVEKAVKNLKGAYAIAAISENDPGKIVVCRKGSPLVIGLGKGENYISSDINAIVSHTKNIMYLEDNEFAVITKNEVVVKNDSGEVLEKEIHHITWDAEASEKQGYPHYMLKEIQEQPAIVRNIISKHCTDDSIIQFPDLRMKDRELKNSSRFIIQACGTSWHAGLIAKYLIEKYARTPTEVDISSEFRYRSLLPEQGQIVVALSQSGETADTLACIREAKSKFFKVLSFVNVLGSSIDRESDGVIYTHSGPEIGVASTKNYVAQLLNIFLFALYLGKLKGHVSQSEIDDLVKEMRLLPDQIQSLLDQEEHIMAIAERHHQSREFIFIGRGVNFPTSLEGALKLKEISYIHATGYPAGELKHGPIALIDEKLPVVCVAPKTATYDKMFANIQEVKARKGQTIVIATEGDDDIVDYADDIIPIPACLEELSPILTVIPLQMLSYNIATLLGCDVDQPRNLAKSVTVE